MYKLLEIEFVTESICLNKIDSTSPIGGFMMKLTTQELAKEVCFWLLIVPN